eukprot:gene9241-10203_t
MPSPEVFFGGCVLLFSACFVASAGGVGGGGLAVPILLLVFGYSFETAVPLSQCVVFGNSLSQCLLNLRHRHPYDPTKSLIWWELVVVLAPAQLGGSNLGSLLSVIFPDSVMYILALVMLLYAMKLTITKGLHKREEEKELREITKKQEMGELADTSLPSSSTSSTVATAALDSTNEVVTVENPMVVAQPTEDTATTTAVCPESGTKISPLAISTATPTTATASRRLSEAELDFEADLGLSVPEDMHTVRWPRAVLITILLTWTTYLGLSLGRAQVSTCSNGYIALFILAYLPLSLGTAWGVWHNSQSLEEKRKLKMSRADRVVAPSSSPLDQMDGVEEVLFSKHALVLPPMVFGIGIICSLLGIGGGELLSPMMLLYHVPPVITSATSAALGLLNTSTLVFRAISIQDFDLNAGGLLFLTGLLGGLVGRKFGLYVSTKLNQASTIIFALAAALFLSAMYYLYRLASGEFDSSLDNPCSA